MVNATYKTLLAWAMDGLYRIPRGNPCRSIFGNITQIDMRQPVITIPERKLNYSFMFAEAYWILSGSNQADEIVPYCKNIKQFSDSGLVFQGAYGPKVTEQLQYVVDILTKDRESRQAVIGIWRENPRESKDIPCTLTMQFLVHKNELQMIVNMRSSDVWLGFPYDIFNFSMIAHFLSLQLYFRPQPTLLRLFAGDQHLYERDVDKAAACMAANSDRLQNDLILSKLESPRCLLGHLRTARGVSFTGNSYFDEIIRYAKAQV